MEPTAFDSLRIVPVDVFVFVIFLIAVVGLGLFKSRAAVSSGGTTSESYFLAGRGLKWWLIGISIIAANISSEQFVGMSGNAADFGFAVASYEWMAAVTLVVVAFFFLPYFLRTGIFTIPHFLEHRYNSTARAIMAIFTLVILIGVSLTGVIYAGALTMSELFMGFGGFGSLGLTGWSLVIGLVAAFYVCAGGLRASAWADLIQGVALVLAGAVVSWLAITKLGSTPVAELAVAPGGVVGALADDASGLTKLVALNKSKLTMFLPSAHEDLPWTALLLGLWIPNFYYWGLNQYITQRLLGSASLREGQKGIVFAAAMKLIIPFVIVMPGVIAFNLYSKDLALAKERANDRLIERAFAEKASTTRFEMTDAWQLSHPEKTARLEAHNAAVLERVGGDAGRVSVAKISSGYKFDASLNLLIKKLLPEGTGLRGFVLAALLGAIVSSLAAVLNAASTIFTMDVFQKYCRPNASQVVLVRTGRVAVLVFALIGCVLAPQLDQFKSIFKYIQEFQGYISPGVLAVFVYGLLDRRAPGLSGVAGLLLSPVFYGLLSFAPAWLGWSDIQFLNRMAVCFFAIMLVMWCIGLAKPLPKPIVFETNVAIGLESSRGAKILGVVIVVVVALLYVVFSPLGLAA
ncbi:MAG: sodium/solute symporter [Puniceicoccales bacterium]|jgi:SSS family solute:Na+ symporter|nr:sodium/solute symporter [Puniceicoccales bacterium]